MFRRNQEIGAAHRKQDIFLCFGREQKKISPAACYLQFVAEPFSDIWPQNDTGDRPGGQFSS